MPADKIIQEIEAIETQIEDALWSLEVKEEIEKALAVYREAETRLAALDLSPEAPAYRAKQRVLAYCLLRQGNLLRQLGEPENAFALGLREIEAARASGDEITLARSLLNNGVNQIVSGAVDQGLAQIAEAQALFESGETYDHQQGAGWGWILQADLVNAGIIECSPEQVIKNTDRALAILTPIENWPGVARAYAARAAVHKQLGDEAAAAEDQKLQAYYQDMARRDQNTG